MVSEIGYGKSVSTTNIVEFYQCAFHRRHDEDLEPHGTHSWAGSIEPDWIQVCSSMLSFKCNIQLSLRETYWAATFKNNATIMTTIQEIFVEEITNILDVAGLGPACVFQPITMDIISSFGKNGGNALGITLDDGPLIRRLPPYGVRSGSSLQHCHHVQQYFG